MSASQEMKEAALITANQMRLWCGGDCCGKALIAPVVVEISRRKFWGRSEAGHPIVEILAVEKTPHISVYAD